MTTSPNAVPKQSNESRLTILAVDDEPTIVQFLALVLRMAGHDVLTAKSGPEALATARGADGESIDVLITDLCMPGMSGVELAVELRKSHPRIKTLFTSGYSRAEIAAMGIDIPDAACLPKPYQMRTVSEAIRALFEPAAVLV